MAGESGGTRLTDQQPFMSGGLNSISDDIALTTTQLRRAINARLTDYGAVTKRGGTRRTSNAVIAAAPVLNGYTWRKDNGTQQIMVVCNGLLHTATYGAFPLTYTSQTGALSTTVPPDMVQFRDGSNDVVYIADGSTLNKWNGSALTVSGIGGTANVSAIVVHNERLWATGDSSFPDSIFYSALNNGDTLSNGSSGGGQIIVRTHGDETIVGLASVNTSLLIFHRRGISRLTGFGQDDITVSPASVTADVGTIAAKSIVSIGNVAFFLSERGLYRCNESEVAPVGTVETPDPLLPIIRSLTSTQFSNIRSSFNRATRELWVSLPGAGVYIYHTVLNAWSGPFDTGYISPQATALFETLDAAGLPVLLKGDESGWVSLCDAPGVYLDNAAANGTGGTRYAMTVQMHRMYCGDDALAKSLRWGYVTANLKGSDQCSVRWSTDTNVESYTLPTNSYNVWGSGTWGSGVWAAGSSQNYRIPMGGTGYYTDVEIVDSGAALPVVSRVQLEQFSLGRR
jgi:hypothetical protein